MEKPRQPAVLPKDLDPCPVWEVVVFVVGYAVCGIAAMVVTATAVITLGSLIQ